MAATKHYSGEEIRRMMLGELPSENAPLPPLGGETAGARAVTYIKARARQHQPGVMNKTEARYADHLELARVAGVVLEWRFEQFTLKLGPDLRYTPDFFVLVPDGFIELHEVKGPKKDKVTGKQTYWAEEDGLVKIRSAAQQFQWFTFRLCWWNKDTGAWQVKEIIS